MVRETARRRGTRGAGLVEYALVLALLVVASLGSIRYLEDETGKEVDNQADCISTRPPPPSCQVAPATPGPDPANPGGSGDPVSGGGSPTAAVATVGPPVLSPQPPTPSGPFDVEVAFVIADDTPAPVSGEIVSAQVVVTQATASTRVGDFFYVDCTTANDGTCTFRFDSRWGTVDELSIEVVAVGIDTPYKFTAPPPLVIGRPA